MIIFVRDIVPYNPGGSEHPPRVVGLCLRVFARTLTPAAWDFVTAERGQSEDYFTYVVRNLRD